MAVAKKPMGRPSTFREELADEICERVASGEPLAQVCRSEHMPALRTVYDWIEARPELAARFARARRAGFDMIALDALRIADEPPPTTQTGGTDSGFVQHSKVRIETRLKLLAKWDPKRYGDRIELAGDESAPLVHRVERVIVKPET